MFTRQHYKAIAGIVREMHSRQGQISAEHSWQYLIDDLSRYFAQDNPQFNRDKFVAACYGNIEVTP